MAFLDILRSLFPNGPRGAKRLDRLPVDVQQRASAYFDDPSHWQRVRSSNVHSIALFIDLRKEKEPYILGVRFAPRDEITEYWYFGVPVRLWSDMVVAASKGRFVYYSLRGYYDYYRKGVVGYESD